MSRLFVLSFLFFTLHLGSQNTIIDKGTTWLYEQFELGDHKEDFYLFTVETDTIVNDEQFYKVSEKYLERTDNGIDTSLINSFLFLFEDGKVKFLDVETDSLLLLYDYSTLSNSIVDIALGPYQSYQEQTLTIPVKINEAIIFSETSVDWSFQHYESLDELYNVGLVVRGIGSTTYMFPTDAHADPFRGGNLVCFTNGVDSYPSQKDCDLVLKNNYKHSLASPRIFPNPAFDEIHIDSDIQIKAIQIFNLQGQLKAKFTDSYSIRLPRLSAGIYVLKAITMDNQVFLKKLTIAIH